VSALPVLAKLPALPTWKAEDKERLRNGEIVVGIGLLTDELQKKQESAEVEVIIEAVQEKPSLPGTETLSDEAVISASYLTKYFGGSPSESLIDPQQLLSMQERADMKYALEEHEKESAVPIYVYLFDAKQKLPKGYSPQEVYTQSFADNESPVVLVYYYMGAPERSEFLLAGGASDEVPEWQVRELLWNSAHKAREKSDVFDQLTGFVGQLSMRLFWVEEILDELRHQSLVPIPSESESANDVPKTGKLHRIWAESIAPHLVNGLLAAGGFLLIVGGVFFFCVLRRYRFPDAPSPSRLGGAVGGVSGGVLRYRDSRVPPSMQKKQFKKDFL
jgi:hypothetical protein